MANEKGKGGALLAGGLGGVALGTALGLAMAPRPAEAEDGPPPPPPPGAVPVYLTEDTMALLREISSSIGGLSGLPAILATLGTRLYDIQGSITAIGDQVSAIAEQIGVKPARTYMLDNITKVESRMIPKTAVNIHVATGQNGVLLWMLMSFNSSDITVTFKIDDLEWKLSLARLVAARVDTPHFPGAWLVRADPDTPHYALLFSAGEFSGLEYKKTLHVTALYTGATTATLNYAEGVKKVFRET